MPGLFARFLRFGLLAWGGPVAQIALLRRELVDDERWVSSARFNRLLAMYQVLPGPEAHELAVHLGMLRGGRLGGLLAGLGFMLPGFVLVLVAAALYVTIDLRQPAIAAALLGVQVAVVGLVARAVERIGRHILVDPWTWAIAAAGAGATLAGVPFWVVLPLSGLVYAVAPRLRPPDSPTATARLLMVLGVVAGGIVLAVALLSVPGALGPVVRPPLDGQTVNPAASETFVSGLKAGLLTFGGAYTAIPFVREDAVGGGWISEGQFLDAVALSGILPSPLIMFAAFVGYLGGGLAGAVAMTLGIFLPAFSFALVFGERLEAIVARPGLHRLLEGVAAGVVGIIAVTTLELALALAGRVPNLAGAALIVALTLAVLYRWSSRLALPAAIAAGAAVGLVVFAPAG